MLATEYNKNQINQNINSIITNTYSLETHDDKVYMTEIAQELTTNLIENKPIILTHVVHELLKKEFTLINELLKKDNINLPEQLKKEAQYSFDLESNHPSLIDSLIDKIKKYRHPNPISLQNFLNCKHKIEITLKAMNIVNQVCEKQNIHSIHSSLLLIKDSEKTFDVLQKITPYIEEILKLEEKNQEKVVVTPT